MSNRCDKDDKLELEIQEVCEIDPSPEAVGGIRPCPAVFENSGDMEEHFAKNRK